MKEKFDFGMEIDPSQASEYLSAHSECVLLDVREPDEHAYSRINESLHIPLAKLSERLDSLDANRPILVYCHHGIRSLAAVRLLKAKGFPKTSSIIGGIERWAIEIDSSLPRY
tara:strand:+ start:161 stop:499 length:339 start_codon:yes stop_codon:yes gene_type:complete